MNPKIWLSSPHMSGNEQKYIKEAFDTNWVAPLGPNVNEFEKDLEKYIKEDTQVVCLSAGTAALHLALIQLGVQAGDYVICQSFTFSASANPIVYQGATPVFVDSEKDTWNMCPEALEQAVKDLTEKGKKPKAIIAVHLYGMPAQIDKIQNIAEAYQIPLIEDAAEALGSKYKNKKCGTFGTFGILSFNGNKIITTSGGGALICKTAEQKQKTIFLSTQARDDAPHYQHSHIGYNYRMSNIIAGIGRGQMEVLEKHIELRRNNNEFYKDIFKNIQGIKVFSEPDSYFYSNHWLSCILIDEQKTGFSSEKLRLHMQTDNIESRPLWKPMHLQPVFNNAPFYGSNIAENLFKQGLCLPSGSNLTDNDKERIKTNIYKLVDNPNY